MSSIEHSYQYSFPSSLQKSDSGFRLQLASEINDKADPGFFEGELLEPLITARCLRTLSNLVGTRFYIPPAMLERILREADPVATVTQKALHFEGFTACCSTYMRHDLNENSFNAKNLRPGTTNVDFGPEMRAALAKVRNETPLQLSVQSDSVSLHQPETSVIENKVPLPIRWIKGFAEVQSHLAGMQHKFSLSRVHTQRFLRALPRGKADHEQWISATASGTRVSIRKTAGSVMVKGSQRLLALEGLARLAQGMDVWFNEQQKSSAWVLNFESQSFLLVLNSEPWRGFSGDGALLSDLNKDESPATTAVKAQLNWQHSINPEQLSETTGFSKNAINGALSHLAAQGLLGFDLKTGKYFHRVLPFDQSLINKLNPRLKSAYSLYEKGAVNILASGKTIKAEVQSTNVVHQVSIDSEGYTCTCPWFAKHKNRRGPCKHILATEIFLEKSK